MSYVIRAVVLLGAAAAAYIWLTSEVPGGEKRYQQWIREASDRHSFSI